MTTSTPSAGLDLSGSSVLVTGSSGYIGSALMTRLESIGARFVGIDKFPPADDAPDSRVFDLGDSAQTSEALRDVSPELVVHTGTHSAIAYRDDFLEAFKADADALINILEALRALPETRLIFFSSSYVYSGLDPDVLVDETTPPNPRHNFGVAKSFFEKLIQSTHTSSVVFRLSSVFGHGPQKHPNAVAAMATECIEHGRLTVWGEGGRRMQYIYLDDVVSSTLEGATLPPGVYNLGGRGHTTVADTAARIAEFFGASTEFLREKREGETLPAMNIGKLREASAEQHLTALEVALPQYLAEFHRE
jgi:nucleoside-diphosphate-sugar epimerase